MASGSVSLLTGRKSGYLKKALVIFAAKLAMARTMENMKRLQL
jgi:hypothetical protein